MVFGGKIAHIRRLLVVVALLCMPATAAAQTAPAPERNAAETALPKLYIIGNLVAVSALDPKLQAEAEAGQEMIRQYLDRSGLSYEFQFLPWIRAYRMALNRSDVLLFNMLRTSAREELFHWLLPMDRSEAIHLIARKGSDQEKMGKDAIVTSQCKAACVVGSAQCQALRNFGFSEDRLIEVTEAQQSSPELLLLRGRVDFIANLPGNLGNARLDGARALDHLAVMMPISEPSTSWLAAPKSIDPRFLVRLQAALPPESASHDGQRLN